MNAQVLMQLINKHSATLARQKAAVTITENTLSMFEAELKKLTK